MKIAAAAYPLDWFAHWTEYDQKLTLWVEEAARAGAELLVFPEYGAMELASLAGAAASETEAALRAVSARLADADALHDDLARRFGVTILAGSAPAYPQNQVQRSRPVNRARLFGPDGPIGVQDKRIMTMFERDPMQMRAGLNCPVFDTPVGRVGVLICYDAEFPMLARALIEAGAEILLVPSCTDSLAGYWRVRIAAMARALEGQCITVQSPTVGAVPWCPPVDENVGAAGIFGPPDLGFPETGVLALGTMDRPGWVYADVSLDAVARVRSEGQVRNVVHWCEQS